MEIISTRRLNSLYAEEGGTVAWSALRLLAEAVLSQKGIAAGYAVDGAALSAAATLDLLARAVARLANEGARPGYLLARSVLGPASKRRTCRGPF